MSSTETVHLRLAGPPAAAGPAPADPIEAMRDHPVAGRPASLTAAVEPLLTDINGLAVLLCRSVAALERDQAAGRLPKPLYLGRSKRWALAEIQDWVQAGMPSRKEWEARKRK